MPGIGASIKVTVKNGTETRAVYRTVGSGSPLEQHVGLGKSAEIVGLEIQWSGEAQPQRFASAPKNKAIEIRQFAGDYRVIERPGSSWVAIMPLGMWRGHSCRDVSEVRRIALPSTASLAPETFVRGQGCRRRPKRVEMSLDAANKSVCATYSLEPLSYRSLPP